MRLFPRFRTLRIESRLCFLPRRRLAAILARLFRGARSSAVEHHLDMVGVTGSIPVARTNLSFGSTFSFDWRRKGG